MANYLTNSPTILKTRARVLGYVSPNYLRIIMAPGVGLADGGIHNDLPLELVPPELRIPNSEFFVYLDVVQHEFVGVERLLDDGGRNDPESRSLPGPNPAHRFGWLRSCFRLFK